MKETRIYNLRSTTAAAVAAAAGAPPAKPKAGLNARPGSSTTSPAAAPGASVTKRTGGHIGEGSHGPQTSVANMEISPVRPAPSCGPLGASHSDLFCKAPDSIMVLTSGAPPAASLYAEELAKLNATLTAMQRQLAVSEPLLPQLVALLAREAEKDEQISALRDSNLALEARVARLEQQLESMGPMQQQLSQLEQQRPASYAAAVTGPAPTPSPEFQNSFCMPLGKHITADAPYQTKVQQLRTTLGELLKEGDAPIQIAHVETVRIVAPKARTGPAGSAPAPAPPPFVVFKVSEGDALQICKLRKQLANTGVTIRDWLTPEENQRRRALMPLFRNARADKLKTYWRRAQLFVAGVEVPLPSAAAAPAAA